MCDVRRGAGGHGHIEIVLIIFWNCGRDGDSLRKTGLQHLLPELCCCGRAVDVLVWPRPPAAAAAATASPAAAGAAAAAAVGNCTLPVARARVGGDAGEIGPSLGGQEHPPVGGTACRVGRRPPPSPAYPVGLPPPLHRRRRRSMYVRTPILLFLVRRVRLARGKRDAAGR